MKLSRFSASVLIRVIHQVKKQVNGLEQSPDALFSTEQAKKLLNQCDDLLLIARLPLSGFQEVMSLYKILVSFWLDHSEVLHPLTELKQDINSLHVALIGLYGTEPSEDIVQDEIKLDPWQQILFKIKYNLTTDKLFLADDERVCNDDTVRLEPSLLQELFRALKQNHSVSILSFCNQDVNLVNACVIAAQTCNNIKGMEFYTPITDNSLRVLAEGHYTYLSLTASSKETARILSISKTLSDVYIAGDGITKDTLFTLLEMPSIKKIKLTGEITDEYIEPLAKLKDTSCRCLVLTSDHVSDKSMKILASLTSLESLDVHSDRITDASLLHFKSNDTLGELILRSNSLSQSGLQYFSHQQSCSSANREYIINHLLGAEKYEFGRAISQHEIADLMLSHEIADLMLSNERLSKKLNGLDIAPNKQSFPHSCAARAIMVLLNNLGCLSDEEMLRTTELRIYSAIWSKPGGIADINKTVAYLRSHRLGVTLYEDAGITSELKKIQRFEEQYHSNFDGLLSHAKKAKVFEAGVAKNTSYLLISLKYGPHILALSHKDGKYIVLDPAVGEETIYESIEELHRGLMEDWAYTGLAMHLTPQVVLSSQNTGFWKKKEDALPYVGPARNKPFLPQ